MGAYSTIAKKMIKSRLGNKLGLASRPPRGPKKGGGPRVIAASGGKVPGRKPYYNKKGKTPKIKIRDPKDKQKLSDKKYYDKNTGKHFKTLAEAKTAGIQYKIKRKMSELKKAQRDAKKSDVARTLKISNRLEKRNGKTYYRKGVTIKLADGSRLAAGGMLFSEVEKITAVATKSVEKAARKRAREPTGGAVGQIDAAFITPITSNLDTFGKGQWRAYTAEERRLGKNLVTGEKIEKIRIKRGKKAGQWQDPKGTSHGFEVVWLTQSEKEARFSTKLSWAGQGKGPQGGGLTDQQVKQGFVKIYAVGGAAAGLGGLGMIGSAYAEPGPAARPGDPMAGVVAIGGDFFQGVRNTASDWTFGATERGGVPSLDVETKSQFGKVTEGAMEQGGMYLFDQPSFQKHSAAGTLPLDQAWGKAGSFAAENPAMFAGEVLGEAAFWAGTMGIGRAVWGVGRGVKLAKLATGPHTTATKAQAGQYKTVWQGVVGGGKEMAAITKKDPFGIWTMGYGGIGKSGKLSGKTKHSVGVVPGFESLGQTNVGKMRRSAGKRYGKGYVKREKSKASPHGQIYGTKSWKAWNPGPQLALPGAHAAKSLTKKGKLTKRSEYLAHVRKLRKTKRQKKEDKIMDNAATEWERAYYSSPY